MKKRKQHEHDGTLSRRAFARQVGLLGVGSALGLPGSAALGRSVAHIAPGRREEVLYNGIRLPDPFPPAASGFVDTTAAPYYLQEPPSPILVDVGRQLFVDDFLIQDRVGLERVYHRPVQSAANPVLVPSAEDTYVFQNPTRISYFAFPYSDGVWWDVYQQRFRMWYRGGGQSVKLMESADGLDWHPVAPPDGSNVLMEIPPWRDSGTVWIDAFDPDPARRYKMAYFNLADRRLWVYASPDGVQWPPYEAPLARSAYWVSDPVPERSYSGDRSTFFYNPFRRKWIWSLKDRIDRSAGGGTPTDRVRRYLETDALGAGAARLDEARLWLASDALDRPLEGNIVGESIHDLPQLYNVDGFAYESLMVCLLTINKTGDHYEDLDTGEVLPKHNEVHVGFSRDGYHVTRPEPSQRGPFLPVGPQGSWYEGNVQSTGGGCVVVGPPEQEQLRFYFSGRQHHYRADDGALIRMGYAGAATLRRDGFASLEAGAAGGTLTTRPIRFDHEGGFLFVNAMVEGGELRVEALEAETERTLDGLGRAECLPLDRDSTRLAVRWQASDGLQELRGRPFRLRFHVRGGALYSFWVSPSPDGASGGYLGAGGPAYEGYQDLAATSTRAEPPGSVQNDVQIQSVAPNPFQDRALVRYTLARPAHVRLCVYDLLGREVALLVDGWQDAGSHAVHFEAEGLPSAVYYARLLAGGRTHSKAMLLRR